MSSRRRLVERPDRKWGEWLRKGLETYRTPKHLVSDTTPDRLTPIFRDRDDLTSSPDLSARIREALAESEDLIVICSPNAAKSQWVNQEIESFQKLGGSNRIFSLIVDGDELQIVAQLEIIRAGKPFPVS